MAAVHSDAQDMLETAYHNNNHYIVRVYTYNSIFLENKRKKSITNILIAFENFKFQEWKLVNKQCLLFVHVDAV